MQNYIPVKRHWLDMYTRFDKPYFTPILRYPIKKIKIDKSLFDYQNELSQSDVLYMLINFDREAWMPILLNKDYYLRDGQHRLEVAKQMGLSFIDVIIVDSELLKGNNKKEGNGKKRRSKEMRRLETQLKKVGAELKIIERRLGLGEISSYD